MRNIFNDRLYWHRGIPPTHVRMVIMGKMESSKSPRILIDWDFSHLDGIIETVLQQKPDHNVYLNGSIES